MSARADDRTPVARRRAGLGLRGSLLLVSALGVAVVGSAWLKARHVRDLASRVQWQSEGFVLLRPGFDAAALESPLRAHDDGNAAPFAPLDPAVRAQLLAAMERYQAGEDRRALQALQRVLEREPSLAPARFYRGVLELLDGHPLAAVADLQRARDAGFSPPDGPCDWWLGVAHLYNGNQSAGRRCLAAVAASGAPQAAQAAAVLGRLSAPEAAPSQPNPSTNARPSP